MSTKRRKAWERKLAKVERRTLIIIGNAVFEMLSKFKSCREAELNHFAHATLIPQLASYIQGHILNVGCDEHIFGETRLDIKKTKATNILGDACHLPFKDKSFDTVTCFGVLHHIPNYEKAIKEMIRVCRGYIVGYEPNLFHPHLCLFTYHLGISKERPLNISKVEHCFNKNGACIVHRKMLLGLKILGDILGHYALLYKLDPIVPQEIRATFVYVCDVRQSNLGNETSGLVKPIENTIHYISVM